MTSLRHVLLAAVATVCVQGLSSTEGEFEHACTVAHVADDDELQLLQGKASTKASHGRSFMPDGARGATAKVLEVLEVGDVSGSSSCEHESDSSCPQVSCGPGMFNLSCANDNLGTGHPTCGACRRDTISYKLVHIQTEKLAEEFGYAKEGSAIPSDLHGILWMDQRGTHVPKCDPNYKAALPGTAPEVALAFGDTAVFDPVTRCVDVLIKGGPKGAWALFDQGGGTNYEWSLARGTDWVVAFCQQEQDPLSYDIKMKLRFPGVSALALIGAKEHPYGYYEMPFDDIIKLTMEKTCFGWNRKNTFGPNGGQALASVLEFLPGDMGKVLSEYLKELVYPVYLVVDGQGQKTEYWEPFVDWVSHSSLVAGNSTIFLGKNTDPSGVLVGRPVHR